ncbi:MAG: dihydroorotate dehydrogenase [Chlorobi bacterium]|nr:dihydroorotate dehydrogenase [Chlorobiota bacterium]
MKTSLDIGSLHLKNRVLVASGTFGYGTEAATFTDVTLGGIVTKSVSLEPRAGNPPSRIAETASGMLNSIGLANVGVEAFLREKMPPLRELDTAIIANIAASSVNEYLEVMKRMEDEPGIDAYEINVSCPNVKDGGLQFGTSCSATAEVVRALRPHTRRPLIIKLTPNVTRISEFALACQEEGADAVSMINTLVGMSINIYTRKPKLSTVTGGLSGPAIKPVALAKVFEASQVVSIPVIGIGGIASWEDAVEFLLAGASAVQVGTMNFIDPDTGVKITRGMEEYARKTGLDSLDELVGAMVLPEGASAPGIMKSSSKGHD